MLKDIDLKSRLEMLEKYLLKKRKTMTLNFMHHMTSQVKEIDPDFCEQATVHLRNIIDTNDEIKALNEFKIKKEEK
tara:strand:+ start:2130 stop:2357 length:228 start_codon:yes stop_codon:yes gene_type:complete